MRKPYQAVRRYPRNISGRDFVVGDLHGCFSQLGTALAALGYDGARDRLFSVGDLVNRGPESDSVLDVVRRYRIKAIRGNHEDMILKWYYAYGSLEYLQHNGGDWFVKLVDSGGPGRAIASFMRALPYAIEIETSYGLVGLLHADAPLDQWQELTSSLRRESCDGLVRRKVLWQRSRWLAPGEDSSEELRARFASFLTAATTPVGSTPVAAAQSVKGITAVIVGHTPVLQPTVRGNVINIDTGAVYGHSLTVLELDDVPALVAEKVGRAMFKCAP
ncbi:metallophosphoesterase [Burkholderia lata]|uniref:metallophosphoesterase n=1 Tax=Burkholderia lata (strain ATCC 17760 / DSM 23089 / LMG 22485 / NCIMB 9086 / R18194 / 383) TaxID=482957 RepID=UPI0014543568|nr:metallophosphoesterase [Burkholderia lata]VWB86656.1 metallophosphoesterase [Burkholderia lata]